MSQRAGNPLFNETARVANPRLRGWTDRLTQAGAANSNMQRGLRRLAEKEIHGKDAATRVEVLVLWSRRA